MFWPAPPGTPATKAQYLWPLSHGLFLLRIRSRLNVIDPIRNGLAPATPSTSRDFLELDKPIGYISVSPGGDLAGRRDHQRRRTPTTDSDSPPRSPAGPSLQHRAHHRDPLLPHALRRPPDGEQPHLVAQSAGLLAARTLSSASPPPPRAFSTSSRNPTRPGSSTSSPTPASASNSRPSTPPARPAPTSSAAPSSSPRLPRQRHPARCSAASTCAARALDSGALRPADLPDPGHRARRRTLRLQPHPGRRQLLRPRRTSSPKSSRRRRSGHPAPRRPHPAQGPGHAHPAHRPELRHLPGRPQLHRHPQRKPRGLPPARAHPRIRSRSSSPPPPCPRRTTPASAWSPSGPRTQLSFHPPKPSNGRSSAINAPSPTVPRGPAARDSPPTAHRRRPPHAPQPLQPRLPQKPKMTGPLEHSAPHSSRLCLTRGVGQPRLQTQNNRPSPKGRRSFDNL
jgi:hypothetical protein